MKLISNYIDGIKKLCERYYVAELFVFGSILSDKFNQDSDIDLLVRFSGVALEEYFDNYMDFKEELELLLKRNVDLLEIQTLKNPILIRSIERDKKLIYGRKDPEMVI
ncbi:MAG: nucleotidyltransferase domain-containing protein [Bacteroidetes bacterium]|nr:MAG: nucleotidyltransferase domain-containing protein [Bacteroidota bacterium]